MRKPLWTPSQECIKKANITRFIEFINKKYNLKIDSYNALYKWSIENIPSFWGCMWEFAQIKASRKYEMVVEDLSKFPGAKWFVGARLNFAENLLKHRDAHPAFIFRSENQKTKRLTYQQLYRSVAQLAKPLREIGVSPGDRVAAYMPNITETPIAMLAATSIGAIWSSCGTELGPSAVIDRFSQINPKVLFTVDGYPYKGKSFDVLANVKKIVKGVSSLEKVVVVPYVAEKPNLTNVPKSVNYNDFISSEGQNEIKFEQLPADHPVYIMFSSGTTGKPKCMVQGAAGILINHLKELILHTDLKREDRIFYIT
ncbi:MAG: AMP-binding protein, partial [Candidatus Bathyarchaeota archaeon]|nr:AMP-binding protein [Candidatus Bathyarchaeota archaeon]